MKSRAHSRKSARKQRTLDTHTAGLPHELVPRSAWGKVMNGYAPSASHHMVAMIITPRGYVAVARCLKCGARNEGLIDILDAALQNPAMEPGDAILHACEVEVEPRMQWLSQHGDCNGQAVAGAIPESVRRLALEIESTARATIMKGEAVPEILFLLTDTGAPTAISMGELPHDVDWNDTTRRIAIAAFLDGVRSQLRANRQELIGAVHVGEVWTSPDTPDVTPAQHPDRREVVVITVASHDSMEATHYMIERANGHATTDAGQKVSLGSCRALDGLFAR